ncbi:MAG: hypothetical protein ACD_62C00452G0002 [uncultured bacterium]|nr:MAG: hypothetical protein ACD_62C00452G0002 [uncultured bacterium]
MAFLMSGQNCSIEARLFSARASAKRELIQAYQSESEATDKNCLNVFS